MRHGSFIQTGSFCHKNDLADVFGPLYPYPKDPTLFSVEYVSAIIIITGITVLSILVLKKQGLILLGWAYFLITLMPGLGIIKALPVYMADRYSHLPSMGLSLTTGMFAVFLWDRRECPRETA